MTAEEKYRKIRDRISGCLFAGALGDALGYPVEFDSLSIIQGKYGEKGIRELELENGRAVFSDDTQMTLFTLEGIIYGYRRFVHKGISAPVEYYIYLSYLRWLKTQSRGLDIEVNWDWPSELAEIPEMNRRRAPGNTCQHALVSGKMGSPEEPVNNSKGCGGVMRTAPLGFSNVFGSPLETGAKAAAITHGHPLGWIPAGMLSDIVYKLIYGEPAPLKDIIEASLADTVEKYSGSEFTGAFKELMERAVALSAGDGTDAENIAALGEGWVGEEALAIAVYCCLRYPGDIKKALTAAVNHDGDSDSTGAIAGNILGAYLGMEAVPADWLEKLELVEVIEKKIDDMMEIVDGSYAASAW